MSILKYKTRGSSAPQGKPRVYFCCHPDDFEKYFECITDEILLKENCTVWYKTGSGSENDDMFFNDLGQMNLFVMPVAEKYYEDAFDIRLEKEQNCVNYNEQNILFECCRQFSHFFGDEKMSGAINWYFKTLGVMHSILEKVQDENMAYKLCRAYNYMSMLERNDIEVVKKLYAQLLETDFKYGRYRYVRELLEQETIIYSYPFVKLAEIYIKEKDYQKAAEFLIQFFDIVETESKTSPSNVKSEVLFQICGKLVNTLINGEDWKRAEIYAKKMLELAQQQSDKDSVWLIINAKERLGEIYKKTGDFETAKGLYLECIGIRRELAGSSNPFEPDSERAKKCFDLVVDYMSLGYVSAFPDNKEAFEEGLKILELNDDLFEENGYGDLYKIMKSTFEKEIQDI